MFVEAKGEEKERIGKLQKEIMELCSRNGFNTRECVGACIFLACIITRFSNGSKEDLLDSCAMTFDQLPEPKPETKLEISGVGG